MRETLAIRLRWIPIVAVLLFLGCAQQANAQGFVSPFIGYNFGGDAGCPEITNCEDKNVNWGIGFGALGNIVGFEGEFSITNNFFGDTVTQSTDVLTFMGNFMLAPKIGPVQPYGVIGLGMMRTSVESATGNEDESQIAWDIGGGLMIFFGQHVGIRGDIRYFHAFEVLDGSNFPNLSLGNDETKLDFGRVAGAVIFKF